VSGQIQVPVALHLGKGPLVPVKKEVFIFALTEHYAMMAYWGVEVELHAVLDLGTRWR